MSQVSSPAAVVLVRPSAGPATVARRAMWVAIGLLSLLSALWVGLALIGGAGLTHESGVLIGLGMDARAGLFYPPLLGPDGYGGTRYGPVHVLLQAGLMRAGLEPIASGHLLTLVAAAGLWAGMAALLRRSTGRDRPPLPWAVAAGFPLLLFVGVDARYRLAGVRPDLLPAALNVWGLACVAGLLASEKRRVGLGPVVLAAALFAVAILAKLSAGFGLAAAALALLANRRVGSAVLLGVVSAGGVALGFLALNGLSHGRLWENFHACANASGRPPVTVAAYLGTLREVLVTDDWTGSLLVLLAVAAWLVTPAKRGVLGLYLPVTIALTLPMYFTPGLSVNHLVDVEVAAVLVLAVAVGAIDRTAWAAAVAALAVAALVPMAHKGVWAKARYRRTATLAAAVARASLAPGPVLSDNAMVPVAAGQRPFLLDDFMFTAVRIARPDAQADLYRRLDEQFFPAVVLRYDPAGGDRAWALGTHFNAELTAHYDLVAHVDGVDRLWIYRPKTGPR